MANTFVIAFIHSLLSIKRTHSQCALYSSYCLSGLQPGENKGFLCSHYEYVAINDGCEYFQHQQFTYDFNLYIHWDTTFDKWYIGTNISTTRYYAYCLHTILDDCTQGSWYLYDLDQTLKHPNLSIEACRYNNTECIHSVSNDPAPNDFCVAHTHHRTVNWGLSSKYAISGCSEEKPYYISDSAEFISWDNELHSWFISSTNIDTAHSSYAFCMETDIVDCNQKWHIWNGEASVVDAKVISGYCNTCTDVQYSNVCVYFTQPATPGQFLKGSYAFDQCVQLKSGYSKLRHNTLKLHYNALHDEFVIDDNYDTSSVYAKCLDVTDIAQCNASASWTIRDEATSLFVPEPTMRVHVGACDEPIPDKTTQPSIPNNPSQPSTTDQSNVENELETSGFAIICLCLLFAYVIVVMAILQKTWARDRTWHLNAPISNHVPRRPKPNLYSSPSSPKVERYRIELAMENPDSHSRYVDRSSFFIPTKKELSACNFMETDYTTEYRVQYNTIYDQDACDLSSCESLVRIRRVLQRYHGDALAEIDVDTIYGEYHECDSVESHGAQHGAIKDQQSKPKPANTVCCYGNDNETHLLNDFNHLLCNHDASFEDVYHTFMRSNLQCLLSDCLIIRRNMDHEGNKELYVNGDDNRAVVRQQFIDRIHSYYMHSFDSGYRLTEADTKDQSAISRLIQKRRANRNKCQSNSKQNNSASNGPCNPAIAGAFSYGDRFFYWDHYRDNAGTIDPAGLPDPFLQAGVMNVPLGLEAQMGLKFWYVTNKYENFQEELLKNAICVISKRRWDQLLIKAKQFLKTDIAKEIRVCPRTDSAQCYDMCFEALMNIHHLVAVMAYCNFDVLSYQFSETFRRNKGEHIDAWKARHSHYYHLARYLREAVECFGMRVPNPNPKEFNLFHGTTKAFLFPSMNAYFKGPFSTTQSYAVALGFAEGNGVVLELGLRISEWLIRSDHSKSRAFPRLNCWDCCWVSDHVVEQEILFIGGLAKLSFNTIIEVGTGVNYCGWVQGLKQATYLMSNGDVWANANIPKTKLEQQMVFRLLSHELHRHNPNHSYANEFKSCPRYFKAILHEHCQNIRTIAFPKESWEESKVHQLLFTDNNGWIKLPILCTIFTNVQEIQFVAKAKHIPLLKNGFIFRAILEFLDKKASGVYPRNTGLYLESISIFIDNADDEELKAAVDICKAIFKRQTGGTWKVSMPSLGGGTGERRIKICIWYEFGVKMSIASRYYEPNHGQKVGGFLGMMSEHHTCTATEFQMALGRYEVGLYSRNVIKLRYN
eukprot:213375_1